MRFLLQRFSVEDSPVALLTDQCSLIVQPCCMALVLRNLDLSPQSTRSIHHVCPPLCAASTPRDRGSSLHSLAREFDMTTADNWQPCSLALGARNQSWS